MKMSAKKPKGALFAFEAAGTQAGWRTFYVLGRSKRVLCDC